MSFFVEKQKTNRRKKMKKKFLSTPIIMLFTVGITSSFPIAAVGASFVSKDDKCTILDDGTASITHYTDYDAKLKIPNTLGEYKVTKIGGYDDLEMFDEFEYFGAFSNCTSLTSVTITDNIAEKIAEKINSPQNKKKKFLKNSSFYIALFLSTYSLNLQNHMHAEFTFSVTDI
jgi:hypothetical protein